MQDSEDTCVICGKNFDEHTDKVVLGEKGALKINSVSEQLDEDIHADAGHTVHSSCRSKFTNKNYVASKLKGQKQTQELSPRKKRSREPVGNTSAGKCLFCGQEEKRARKGHNKSAGQLTKVRTMDFQKTVLEQCCKRNDRWSRDVKANVEFMQDLVAQDAEYHNVCFSNFCKGLKIPKMFAPEEPDSKKARLGRPPDQQRLKAFQHVVDYLERTVEKTDTDQIVVTMTKLVEMMEKELTQEVTAYIPQYMKIQLKDYFGDEIIIAEKKGAADIITLKKTASSILRNFYKQPKSTDPGTEKLRLLKAAANLLLNDIKSLSCSKDTYPEIEEEEKQLSFLPDTLNTFLMHLFKRKDANLKLAAIGQAIIQIIRPNKVLPPLQIGLGVQMHKVFGSRFLVDTLNRLGFCSSYMEVRKFEMNAAAQQGLDLPSATKNRTIQFVADNVDHNLVTMDGHNTFHGMGIIAVTTPGVNQPKSIPRRDVKLNEIKAIAKFGIYFYR